MVADGMGGGVAGDTASSITIREFTKSFLSQLFSSELEYDLEKFKKVIKDNLVHAYEKCNKKVYKVAKKSGSVRDMGSTLVTAFSLGSWLITGNVGDSRAYILRKNSAELFTQDQSLVMQMVREGKLTYEQAMQHPQKNVILEAIGTAPHANADYRERDLTVELTTKRAQRLTPSKPSQKDRIILLLCSDGLSDVVSDDQMRKVVFG
jgi:protein phosphatase